MKHIHHMQALPLAGRLLLVGLLLSSSLPVSSHAEDGSNGLPGVAADEEATEAAEETTMTVEPAAWAGAAWDSEVPERGFFIQNSDVLVQGELPLPLALVDVEPAVLLRSRPTDGIPWRYADLFTFLDQIPGIGQEEALAEEALYDIPLVKTPSVENHLRFFHTAIRDRFEQWLIRLSRYRPLVEQIFLEFDLPTDLVFLSLVESGFNPHAYSRARATGPWQFMKGTARLYGLRVDQYVDERRDPIKSTVAAARYLRDLYDLFGTWPLAMAAYNAGEGRVMRALQKAQAESLWDIIRSKKLLKRETREYVPRFMAAMIIAKNPDRYGFNQEPTDPHAFEEVVVRKPVHLRALAEATAIPLSELKQLNPELRRDVTPPDDPEYLLKVPVGSSSVVEEKLATLKPWKGPRQYVKKKGNPGKAGSEWYRVRVGDSLWKIAKRFGVTVQELKEWNNLSATRIRPGDLLALAP